MAICYSKILRSTETLVSAITPSCMCDHKPLGVSIPITITITTAMRHLEVYKMVMLITV